LISTLDLVVLARNRQKISWAFLKIFEVKVEKFKNVESYKNFPLPIFGYFAAVVALYHCAIIHSLSSSNKLSTGVGVFGLSRLLAHFFVFKAHQSLRLHI